MVLRLGISDAFDGEVSSQGGGEVDASIVPELGRTVWNPGLYEGIPADDASGRADGVGGATQYGSTLTAGASTATIQAAINNAAAEASASSRRFVKLGAGVFTITSTLRMQSYVTLRGTINADGFTRDTIIRNSTGITVIEFTQVSEFAQGDWGTVRSITVNTQKDDATVTVNDASNFNVGDIIQIDTLRDGSVDPASNDGEDYGSLPIVYDPPNAGNWCWNGDGNYFVRSHFHTSSDQWPESSDGVRSITEAHEILAKNGNVLTIYDPDAAVIKGSPCRSPMYLTPQAYLCRGARSDVRRYSALEDLKFEPSSSSGNGIYVIIMDQAAFCWFKNIEIHGDNSTTTFAGPAIHIRLGAHTYRCEITECYLHGFDELGPGGAYGIRMQGAEHYIHNNVVVGASKPINLEHTGGGNVIAYNYVDEATLEGGFQECGISTHLSFCHYDLFEGNWTCNMGSDTTHGNNGFITMFRNFSRGCNSSSGTGPPDGYIRGIHIGGWNREMYSIGNVLVDPVLADNLDSFIDDKAVQPAGGSAGGGVDHCIYWLGAAPVLMFTSGNADDWDNGEAGNNFHRHLDYDAFNDDQYDNSANPVKTLVDSLHRTTAPDYFDGHTWPWVDPSQSSHGTRVLTLPAKARYDAGEA